MRLRRIAPILLALVALTPAGAAAATSPVPAGREGSGEEVLATIEAGRTRLWRRIAGELAELFGARTTASWFMRSLGEQCLVLEAPAGRAASDLARRVASFPGVSGATPVTRFRVLANASPDSYLSLQTIYEELHLRALHRTATGAGVSIALIDTGLDVEHPELEGRVERARDFVGAAGASFTADVHGTEVAGIVAAREDDGTGIIGVAPGARIWALKACWPDPPGARTAVCDSYTLALAIDEAIVEKARILNLSLAGEHDALIERLVRRALAGGQVVVAAAEGLPTSFPASIPGVIATYAWNPAPNANRLGAPAVPAGALAAVGSDLLTTVPHGRYDFASGSSFAAAQVSGAVALLLERRPELDAPAIERLLVESAGVPERADGEVDPLRLLDACAALSKALGEAACEEEAGEREPASKGR